MSLLDAIGLCIGKKMFINWDPKNHTNGLIPALVTAVKMGTDLNPCRLFVEVTRMQSAPDHDNVLTLLLQRNNIESNPKLLYVTSGEEVLWSLPPDGFVAQNQSLGTTLNQATKVHAGGDLFNSYMRPIRFMSNDVQKALDRFPTVSTKAMQVNANIIRRDIRADTPCTLLEWESLVIYVTRTMNIPIAHIPEYKAIDVPRYDQCEMQMSFSTLYSLLSVFRHLTTSAVLKLVMKTKKRRNRRARGVKQLAKTGESGLLQVIGDFVCQRGGLAFTIGSTFHPSIAMKSGFQYPVLYRHTNDWDNRDRRFVHDISLQWMSEDLLRPLKDAADEEEERQDPVPRAGRKRLTETFMGFKWIRAEKQDTRRQPFHAFNASDVNGTLHFCVPSTVFVGSLYVSEITRLCEDALKTFNFT